MKKTSMQHHTRRPLAAATAGMLLVTACFLGGCQTQTQSGSQAQNQGQQQSAVATSERNDSLYQVALLQSLTLGDYNGVISVAQLKEKGDTGIGTFEAVNGELVMLDGTVYQCLGDGTVRVANDDTTIPFSNVTFLDGDIVRNISATGIDGLKAQLSAIVEENGANEFYMVRVDATCSSIDVRSELGQEEPYETFDKVLARDQREYSYNDVKGSIVALYCPSYAKGVNTPGWHFHFISDDRTKGGHVLSLGNVSGTATLDKITEIDIKLPDDEAFNSLGLDEDQSSRITSVEQKTS